MSTTVFRSLLASWYRCERINSFKYNLKKAFILATNYAPACTPYRCIKSQADDLVASALSNMLLSYIFDDYTTKMEISPDVIAFGSNRVAVKNLSSVSTPRNLRIWKALDAAAIPINLIAIVSCMALSTHFGNVQNDENAVLVTFVLLMAAYISLVMLVFYAFNIRATRNVVLLTAGGNITVFRNIRRSFAREITRVLHDVMAGRETRRLRVDRRKRTISVIEPDA